MALVGYDLFEGRVDKVAIAIERIRSFCPPEGYYLAFSGGKDSICIKELAIRAGVKFDAHYSVTTIDPPEVVRFIKKFHPDVIWDRPKEHFLTALVRKGFPLRQARWCCELYKEDKGAGRTVLLGIRWAESFNRSKRKMTEQCFKGHQKNYVNPIIDWTDEDVWEFIKGNNLPYPCLYDEGWSRVGCLFCPFTRYRTEETSRYPGMTRAFKIAFRKLYAKKKSEGKTSVDRWKDGDEMFDWWISRASEGLNEDQMIMFGG